MVAVAQDRQLVVDLYPAQDAFVFDEARYPAFIGGRNAGKTFSGALKAYLRARDGGLGVIAAPSFPMLMHGAKRQFIERLQALGWDYRENKAGSTFTRSTPRSCSPPSRASPASAARTSPGVGATKSST
jgi:hypothetical protein